MKKFLCILLSALLVFSVIPPAVCQYTGVGNVALAATGTSPNGLTVPAATGRLDVEFENLTINSVNGSQRLQRVTSAPSGQTLSNGAALAPISGARDDTASATETPDIDLSFIGETADTYYVWVRYYSEATYFSILSSIEDHETGTDTKYEYTYLSKTDGEYKWMMLGAALVKNAGDLGKFRIRLRHRTNTTQLDKIVITNQTIFAPEGIDGTMNWDGATIPTGKYSTPTANLKPPANQHPRLMFNESDKSRIQANMTNSENAVMKARFDNYLDDTHKELYGGGSSSIVIQPYYQNEGPQGSGLWPNRGTDNLPKIETRAINYAVNGNESDGLEAITYITQLLEMATYDSYSLPNRAYGHLVFIASKVYDWCYDLFERQEIIDLYASLFPDRNVTTVDDVRNLFILMCEIHLMKNDTVGYPPVNGGTITGHGSESMLLVDMLAFAIAVYDEKPELYDLVMGRILDEYVEPRNFWNESDSYHQGTGYVTARHYWDVYAHLLIKRMTGQSLFNEEGLKGVAYSLLYNTRTDTQHFRAGDDYQEYGNERGAYWNSFGSIFFMGAVLFDDPYLYQGYWNGKDKTAYSPGNGNQGTLSLSDFFVLKPANLETKAPNDLEKSMYMGSPNGTMIARTGWNFDSYDPAAHDDVIAFMKIGELNAANHEHRDAGHFQLYYKGILASDSGWYGDGYGTAHDAYYHKSSIAHNTIDVYKKGSTVTLNSYGNEVNKFTEVPSGATTATRTDKGQRIFTGEPSNMNVWIGEKVNSVRPTLQESTSQYKTGEVLAHGYGDDADVPEYTYIRGDITKAYEDGTYTDVTGALVDADVREVLRTMLFMPLDDEDHPGAMIVFDKVTSPDSTYQKDWLLHMQQKPVSIDKTNNRVIIENTMERSVIGEGAKGSYGGRMELQTLLPRAGEANYLEIGGDEGSADVGADGTGRFVANGKNYANTNTNYDYTNEDKNYGHEVGWGRIEISPVTNDASGTDYFLNVMTVADAGTTAQPVESTLLETTDYYGAAFLDRVCYFKKEKARTNAVEDISIPGTGTKKVFVDGLNVGVYSITGSDGTTFASVASKDSGVLYFDAEAGVTYDIAFTEDGYAIANVKEVNTGVASELTAEIAGNPTSAKVIFAAYDNDRLVDVKMVDFAGYGKYSTSIHSGSSFKVFLWKDMATMDPLAKSYTLDLGANEDDDGNIDWDEI